MAKTEEQRLADATLDKARERDPAARLETAREVDVPKAALAKGAPPPEDSAAHIPASVDMPKAK